MSIPAVNSPIGPVSVIDSRVPAIFKRLPGDFQRTFVSHLTSFIEQVEHDGSILHLLRLQVLRPDTMHEKHFKKDHLLEKCYWQLAQLYRASQ